MVYAVIAAASVVAGVIQSVTGFGAAVFLMLIVPYFFDMLAASALSSAIAMGLGIALAWKFRAHIQWEVCALPTAAYLLCSVTVIRFLKKLDLEGLSLAFGIFLILMSVYFFVCSKRISFRATWKTAVVCGGISGITSGLFGIGGPLMALYFVSASRGKESYIGNIQFLFGATNFINLLMRMANGIYTVDLIPLTLVGFLGINAGKQVGLRVLHKLNVEMVKKLVYAYVGISGGITVIQQLI